MHLSADAYDSFCFPGYVVAVRLVNMVLECSFCDGPILFDEVGTSTISAPEKAELVTIFDYDTLIVCCQHQPSSTHTVLHLYLLVWINIILCYQLSVETLMFINLPGCIQAIIQVLVGFVSLMIWIN